MRFSKQRMMARLKKEGRLDQVDSEAEAIMNNLDGQEATASCWERIVHNAPVYWVKGKDGKGYYVNENDCE